MLGVKLFNKLNNHRVKSQKSLIKIAVCISIIFYHAILLLYILAHIVDAVSTVRRVGLSINSAIVILYIYVLVFHERAFQRSKESLKKSYLINSLAIKAVLIINCARNSRIFSQFICSFKN